MKKLPLALSLLFLLPLGAHAQAECPDGDVKWDCVADEFVYVVDDPNAYQMLVDPQEDGWDLWTIGTPGCRLCTVCISYGDELEWRLGDPYFGAAQNADHVVFWGSCQIPCVPPLEALPYKSFLPLQLEGRGEEPHI